MRGKTFVVVLFGLSALGIGGCAGCTEDPYPGYCDSTGCYACEAEGQCWPVSHPACGTDLECAAGERCTSIGCAPVCLNDAECQSGEICEGGFCAPAGVVPTPVDPNTGDDPQPPVAVPESCTTDEECQRADPALVCDTETGKCIDACTSNADCPPGYVCAPCGKCTPEDTPTCGDSRSYCDVNDPASCGPDRACLTGHCHLTCDGQSACPIGQVCQAGVCVDDPSPQSPQCQFDAQCVNARCINGYCHPKCTSDTDCGPAEMCLTGEGTQGVCMPDYRPPE